MTDEERAARKRAYKRAYYLKNRDRILAQEKERHAEKREQHNARSAAYYAEFPEKYAEYSLKRKYGITLEQYQQMLQAQGGVCAIKGCGASTSNAKKKSLAVDHCHETGQVRGLLCSRCNMTLGRYREKPELLQGLVEYILIWQRN